MSRHLGLIVSVSAVATVGAVATIVLSGCLSDDRPLGSVGTTNDIENDSAEDTSISEQDRDEVRQRGSEAGNPVEEGAEQTADVERALDFIKDAAEHFDAIGDFKGYVADDVNDEIVEFYGTITWDRMTRLLLSDELRSVHFVDQPRRGVLRFRTQSPKTHGARDGNVWVRVADPRMELWFVKPF